MWKEPSPPPHVGLWQPGYSPGGSSVGGLTLGLVGKLEQAIHMHNLAGSQACCAEVKYKPLLNSLDSTVGKTRPETPTQDDLAGKAALPII